MGSYVIIRENQFSTSLDNYYRWQSVSRRIHFGISVATFILLCAQPILRRTYVETLLLLVVVVHVARAERYRDIDEERSMWPAMRCAHWRNSCPQKLQSQIHTEHRVANTLYLSAPVESPRRSISIQFWFEWKLDTHDTPTRDMRIISISIHIYPVSSPLNWIRCSTLDVIREDKNLYE